MIDIDQSLHIETSKEVCVDPLEQLEVREEEVG
jgi:hypothetical protein